MTSVYFQVATRIKNAVIELGKNCIALAQDAGNLQSNPNDEFCQNDLNVHVREVTEKVNKSCTHHTYMFFSLGGGGGG